MDKKTLLMMSASVILILLLLAAAYYKIQLSETRDIIFQAEPDPACDLQKNACIVRIPDGGVISFSIEPRPIPLVTKLTLKVDLKAIDARAVNVDFQGTTMNMGPNSVLLNSVSRDEAHRSYQGSGMLPVCIRNHMEWKAQVFVQTDEGVMVVPFLFVTHK